MSDRLLDGAARIEVAVAGRDPVRWPGYQPVPAVQAWRLSRGRAVAVTWDFSVYGGSFGEDDATVFSAAVDAAVHDHVPLVTVVRSGGTRLQEGMAALVGIPRCRIALRRLADAGLGHLSVADAPCTGGVWIAVTASADVRAAVVGATVGFAGPRVVEAVTGSPAPPGSNTAESAYGAGLVDALVPVDEVGAWVAGVLDALGSDWSERVGGGELGVAAPDGPGWEQVRRARSRAVGGRWLLDQLLTQVVPLRAPAGDDSVAAAVGRLDGRSVVCIALAAEVGGRPTPDGYRLATRATRLAERLGLPVLTLVDTPGAEPDDASERGGIAAAMGETLDSLLACRTPTVAVVHGEGGSGGALAAAAADVVLVTPDAYFAAIGPEGAAAALRRPPEECMDLMGITPAQLVQLGFADAVVAGPEAASSYLSRLAGIDETARLATRNARWGDALPGNL